MDNNISRFIRIGSVLQKLFKNKVGEGLLDHPVFDSIFYSVAHSTIVISTDSNKAILEKNAKWLNQSSKPKKIQFHKIILTVHLIN